MRFNLTSTDEAPHDLVRELYEGAMCMSTLHRPSLGAGSCRGTQSRIHPAKTTKREPQGGRAEDRDTGSLAVPLLRPLLVALVNNPPCNSRNDCSNTIGHETILGRLFQAFGTSTEKYKVQGGLFLVISEVYTISMMF